ncbi:MAG: UDP-glucose 4-epimerase GalE [Verrucomicrobiota bacterium]
MRVLVTGGAGYIGSVAVDSLIDSGSEVVVFDNFYQGHRSALNAEADFVEGDLADADAVEKLMSQYKPDSVMHFASYTLVGESTEDPLKYLGDNTTNASNLLKAGLRHGLERFILSSTANLFDEPERIPIGPGERIVPGSPYGESKYFIERMLHWAHETKGLRYAALRYFNAAGCTARRGEDHDPETHLIPLVLQVALGQREKIMMFGDDYETPDGTCVRDYIHVEDLAQAHVLALKGLLDKEVLHYNLGNGNGFSVKEVIETAREVTGHEIPAEVAPRRAGDPATLIADSTKIRDELGWTPKYADLKSIIQSAWDWHEKTPSGYGD